MGGGGRGRMWDEESGGCDENGSEMEGHRERRAVTEAKNKTEADISQHVLTHILF